MAACSAWFLSRLLIVRVCRFVQVADWSCCPVCSLSRWLILRLLPCTGSWLLYLMASCSVCSLSRWLIVGVRRSVQVANCSSSPACSLSRRLILSLPLCTGSWLLCLMASCSVCFLCRWLIVRVPQHLHRWLIAEVIDDAGVTWSGSGRRWMNSLTACLIRGRRETERMCWQTCKWPGTESTVTCVVCAPVYGWLTDWLAGRLTSGCREGGRGVVEARRREFE